MRPLRILVNADDLGMSAAVNDAVFAAIDAGICTATSLLATGPAADDALARARRAGLAVGVHLDLTGFTSLTRPPGVTGADGRFLGDVRALSGIDSDAAVAEWVAQVSRVRDAGVVVDHLDSHQHVHHLPALRRALSEVCARTGVRRVRGMGALRPTGAGTRLGALLQPVRAARFRDALRAEGLVTTDGFAPVSVFLDRPRQFAARGWETVELMAHPGNPHHARYAEETARLAAGALDRVGRPIVKVGWGEIG